MKIKFRFQSLFITLFTIIFDFFNEICNFVVLYYFITKRNPSLVQALLCFIDEDKKELLEIIDSFKNSRAKIQNL